jgi:S1-C subfamily serine protease
MKAFISRIIWVSLFLGLLAGCRASLAGSRTHSVPERSWSCSYVWPDRAAEKTKVRLTKPPCREPVPRRTILRVLDSTVILHVEQHDPRSSTTHGFSGVGTVIGTDGTVVTANHVVSNAVSLSMRFRTVSSDGLTYGLGDSIPMEVVANTQLYDTAILRPLARPAVMPPPLQVCRRQPHAGDTLWHVGNRTAWSVGKVGPSPRTFLEEGELVRVHGFSYLTLGYYGDSGGPIFDANGHVWGLYVSMDGTLPMHGDAVALGPAFKAMGFHAQFESCD